MRYIVRLIAVAALLVCVAESKAQHTLPAGCKETTNAVVCGYTSDTSSNSNVGVTHVTNSYADTPKAKSAPTHSARPTTSVAMNQTQAVQSAWPVDQQCSKTVGAGPFQQTVTVPCQNAAPRSRALLIQTRAGGITSIPDMTDALCESYKTLLQPSPRERKDQMDHPQPSDIVSAMCVIQDL